MPYSNLLYEVTDSVAVVTVDRPAKLNALNRETFAGLEECFRDAAGDAGVGAIIITGAGEKAFVAGADIGHLADLNPLTGREWAVLGQRVFSQMETMTKPVIAAINGYALGGGLELAMACHIRIASPNARLGLPEVKLGLLPGNGGTQRLPRLVGAGRALEMILTGELVSAEEALRIGLVNRVVEQPRLLAAAREVALTILQNGAAAVGLCLQAVLRGLEMPFQAALEWEASQFGVCCGTEDAREGVRAFLEKRKAQFRGR